MHLTNILRSTINLKVNSTNFSQTLIRVYESRLSELGLRDFKILTEDLCYKLGAKGLTFSFDHFYICLLKKSANFTKSLK